MSKSAFSCSIDMVLPSPENDDVYGAVNLKDLETINLANNIAENGILEPIVISKDRFIISGHRRYAAAKLVGIAEIPVRVENVLRSDFSSRDWKKKLVAFNCQRTKSDIVKIREVAVGIDEDIAFEQLCSERDQKIESKLTLLDVKQEKQRSLISAGKMEMLAAAINRIKALKSYWPLSVRQIHYQLLNDPPLRNTARKKQQRYQNDRNSYQDLCELLARARLLELVPWRAITDETRPVGNTWFCRDASEFFDIEFHRFLRMYRRDLMQSQTDHVELVVEKMTVQNIIGPIANRFCVPITTGRGYCSLDPRHEIVQRFRASGKRKLILLIASDFDPDGDGIADSFYRSLRDDFGVTQMQASKILLRHDQVREWSLPANNEEAKTTSSRYDSFITKYQSQQVFELEAVPIELMERCVEESILSAIDIEAFNEQVELERADAQRLAAMKTAAKEFFGNSDLSELFN